MATLNLIIENDGAMTLYRNDPHPNFEYNGNGVFKKMETACYNLFRLVDDSETLFPVTYRLISERFKEALDDSGVKEEDILYIEVGHETDSNGNAGVWYVEIAECWDDEDLESDDPNDEGYGIDQTERPIKHRLSTSVGLDFISECFRLARKTTTEAEIAAMMMP